jgi:adenine phosphoribosyltransferase
MNKLKSTIRSIPHFPIEKVTFRDISTLLKDKDAFQEACNCFYERYKDQKINKVIGIEARGFIFGAVLAYRLGAGFVPIRKKGKLPYYTISEKYDLEYGIAEIEIHKDAINEGERVIIIDDLIATGGTISAAIKLVKMLKGEIIECAFLVELVDLKARDLLEGVNIFSLVEFEGE